MRLAFSTSPASRLLLLVLLMLAGSSCHFQKENAKVLVLTSATAAAPETRLIHDALLRLAHEEQVQVEVTTDPAQITESNLRQYQTVVFLHTPASALNYVQQVDFQRFIQAGGGFVSIGSGLAEGTEWPWYAQLEQAQPLQKQVASFAGDAPATNQVRNVHFDGGRVSFLEVPIINSISPDENLKEALRHALGNWSTLDYGKVSQLKVPEENRFHRNVLFENLNEPMELTVAPDRRVLFVDRVGILRLFSPADKSTKIINKMQVEKREGNGLLGITLDPDFARNNYVYLFYTPLHNGGQLHQRVSRFTLGPDSLDLASEKVLLKIPIDLEKSAHTGGSLTFDNKGNLFISTGDNTVPFESKGHSPHDERAGRPTFDAQRSSGNTNDLRGKILRIKPKPDGTYSIPKGNLFAKNGKQGRPEIYVMGCRNPYRISVDNRTGFLYWGEIGPDAGKDSEFGPRGYDEFNQARKPGNFGWPYAVGENIPYPKVDFETSKVGDLFDLTGPINNSPNNTGAKKLPPVQPAFIAYPYSPSEKHPVLGEGGRCAIGGPVYRYDPNLRSDVKFPEYYDGVMFVGDWMRNWIMAVHMDKDGNHLRTEPFLPLTRIDRPVDIEFGPDGALYVLEYGEFYGLNNDDASLVRIEFNAGNRAPVALATASDTIGAAPLTVTLSGKDSYDVDEGDAVKLAWSLNGKPLGNAAPTFTHTFQQPGEYTVTLTATDPQGKSSDRRINLKVGNAMPVVKLETTANQSFYWEGRPFTYKVLVEDKEDGKVDPKNVQVRLDYLPQGKDIPGLLIGHQDPQASQALAGGKGSELMANNDCKACHTVDKRTVGPSFQEISAKYTEDDPTVERLASKVITGGGGVWGEHAMNAHPQLSKDDASALVRYILGLKKEGTSQTGLAPQGSLALNQHVGMGDEGMYVFTASYTDRGGQGIGPLTDRVQLLLRHPKLEASTYDSYQGVSRAPAGKGAYNLQDIGHGGYISFKNIDLRNISHLTYTMTAAEKNGYIEVRVGSPTGPVVSRLNYESTGSWRTWKELTAPVQDPGGKNELFFVFGRDQEPKGNLLRLRSIEFLPKEGQTMGKK